MPATGIETQHVVAPWQRTQWASRIAFTSFAYVGIAGTRGLHPSEARQREREQSNERHLRHVDHCRGVVVDQRLMTSFSQSLSGSAGGGGIRELLSFDMLIIEVMRLSIAVASNVPQ